MEKEIKYYYTLDGKCPYIEWRNKLDLSIRLRINKRMEKLKDGLYGNYKKLQNSELSELKLDFGKGYRIYYYDLEEEVILFIAGSDKKDQKKVIEKANEYFNEYIERTGYGINR